MSTASLATDENMERVLADGSVGGGEFVCLEVPDDWTLLASRLHPDEAAYAARFGPRRQVGWAAGRFALRRAMQRAGVDAAGAILATSRGAPALGAHVAGSISHKGAVAAGFASVVPGCRVGVDIERLRPARVRIARRVLTPREMREVEEMPEQDRWSAVLVRFCVKEAVFKAVDPLLQRTVDFTEVEVSMTGAPGSVKHAFAVAGQALAIDVHTVQLREHLIAFASARAP